LILQLKTKNQFSDKNKELIENIILEKIKENFFSTEQQK
jgi:hypothetical protein